jgi:hypothetical protein
LPCDGLIPVKEDLPVVCKIHTLQINSEWEQARKPNPSKEEEEEEEEIFFI